MTDERIVIDEKSATPLELFFDLVFVFAITQVASLVTNDLTLRGLFHAVLVPGILWIGWGQFTWAANSIDLEPRIVRVVILVAMAAVFIIAQAVGSAFTEGATWVAMSYFIVRALGLWMFWYGTRQTPAS